MIRCQQQLSGDCSYLFEKEGGEAERMVAGDDVWRLERNRPHEHRDIVH